MSFQPGGTVFRGRVWNLSPGIKAAFRRAVETAIPDLFPRHAKLGKTLAQRSLRKMPASRTEASTITRASALAWLESRVNYERTVPTGPGGAESFGLLRMRQLLTAIGNPHTTLRVVHVAGTKGKGSTVAMIAGILTAAGHRVGHYLSPHVHTLEERINIDGQPISPADLVWAFAEVMPAVDALDSSAERQGRRGPTWFEVVTAMAMVHFARAGVGIAVLETGLGGRLDATNVSHPVLSVITNVSLDHMELLGSTVAAIAAEKAGIIKRGCPVISGALDPEAQAVIVATAARRRAPLQQLQRDFRASYRAPQPSGTRADHGGVLELWPTGTAPPSEPLVYKLGMEGRHQAWNASLAVMAVRLLNERGFPVPSSAIEHGLLSVRLPARIETISIRPRVVIDAAHNVASMQSLMETLSGPLAGAARLGQPRVLLFAASGDKQIEEMLAEASGYFDQIVVTQYVTNPRAARVERLISACRSAGLPPPQVAATPGAAMELARQLATPEGFVCVAGSFFLAAEIQAGAADRPPTVEKTQG